ncbi:hypothetical protein BDW22DRAFT_589852 [Trametopsis cervina]|nr:hypothetical protein BDW22DRAFT_589852 [Trametopsis cervina]
MAPESKSFEFNIKTVQSCFEYLSDALDWLLSIDDYELRRVSRESESEIGLARLPDFLTARIHALLFVVRRVANRYPAINRLPAELLSAIFEALMPADPRITFDGRRDNEDDDDDDEDEDSDRESIGEARYQAAHAAPSLVCQHWREVTLGTPALWTDIYVSSCTLLGNRNNPYGAFISTQLARSGNCPLNVQLDTVLSPASLQLLFIQDLLKHTHHIRRLTMHVQSTNDDAEIHLWTANASQLEVLDITEAHYDTSASRPSVGPPLSSEAHAPRLQTLVMYNPMCCRMGMFRTLRHLLVKFYSNASMANLARGLMDVLALNAHTLEDLVVANEFNEPSAADEQTLTSALEGVVPVDMPALHRLLVQDNILFRRIIEPRLVLHACARDYDLMYSRDPRFNRFLAKRLFVSCTHIIVTDGTAAARTRKPGQKIAAFVDTRNVKELWLRSDYDINEMLQELEELEPMHVVKKLVILAALWSALTKITKFKLFPALEELQLHSQKAESYCKIVDFLAERKADGRAIKTLRLVRDRNASYWTEDFPMFVERRSEFEKYVANVVYEDVPCGSQPPRMELPTVCTTGSLVHEYWNPWKMG